MLDAPLDLLAIMPHPDDAELLCGGTLANAADRGRRVGILDLARGESASRGTVDERADEAAMSARILGVVVRENLGLPDAAMRNDPESREHLVRAIRRFQPRVVIAPALEGRHPDHHTAAQLIRDACFLAGIAKIAPDLPPHRPFKVLHCITYREDPVPISFIVDISDTFERKLQAIQCFGSQFDGLTQAGEAYPNGEPLYDLVRHQAAHYGSRIRRKYGEPFWTVETMRVDDVTSLDVSTF
jgi:bacillithiol biosynthesis deacetylase BshB1